MQHHPPTHDSDLTLPTDMYVRSTRARRDVPSAASSPALMILHCSSCCSRRGATSTRVGKRNGNGGGCWRTVRGQTRHGVRPSAATAARATRCTWPCRRACRSPPSTTRRRGGASAATASTCHERSPPPSEQGGAGPTLHYCTGAGWFSPCARGICSRLERAWWPWRRTTLTGCRLWVRWGILRLCMAFSVPRAGIRTALPRARGAERSGGMAAVRRVSACWIEEGGEAERERLRRQLPRPTPACVRIICSKC
jgi:hypothetical protein